MEIARRMTTPEPALLDYRSFPLAATADFTRGQTEPTRCLLGFCDHAAEEEREYCIHWALAVVIAYVALITHAGIRFSQRVKTAKDFFLAGRSLAWWVIGLSIIGTNVDTNGYIGASGNAYSIVIAQVTPNGSAAIPP